MVVRVRAARTSRSSTVCAVIENGGHGGTAAAPAALQVFEHYFHQHAPPIGSIYSD